MEGATSGYNEGTLHQSIEKLQYAYNNLYSYMCGNVQKDLIDFVATGWACGDAQDYFRSVATNLNETLRNVTATYATVVESLNAAGRRWAEKMGSSYSRKEFAAQ